MSEAEITKDIEDAIKMLFEKQPNIFELSAETGQTEWNLAHHLASELHLVFPDYDCDFDVKKVNLGNRRPDIILHERGPHGRNFLVIEVKRDGTDSKKKKDIEKIKTFWFKEPLHYEFGAVVNLRQNKTYEVEVFKRSTTNQ